MGIVGSSSRYSIVHHALVINSFGSSLFSPFGLVHRSVCRIALSTMSGRRFVRSSVGRTLVCR